MQYWNSVLSEVLQKHDDIDFEKIIDPIVSDDFPIRGKSSRQISMYYVGDQYPDIYLTRREAESIFWIVQGKTIPETAHQLKLSARTVEFYIKNLKLKFNCNSKKKLVEKILQTNLLEQLEKEGMRIDRH